MISGKESMLQILCLPTLHIVDNVLDLEVLFFNPLMYPSWHAM